MTRFVLLGCLWIGIAGGPAEAQVEVAVHGGVHVDRAGRPDRVVTEGGAEMWAAEGEASALGARVGYWLRPTLGLQLDLSRSSNASWFGHTPVPPRPFANRTTYLSARGVARTSAERRMSFFAAAGPAVMLHGGPGENLRTRDTELGGVLEGGARLRIAGRLGMELAVSNYLYRTRYAAAAPPALDGTIEPAGGIWRHDLLLVSGLVYSWGR
jgi:hypothetical protein